jgi:hypothetical protein
VPGFGLPVLASPGTEAQARAVARRAEAAYAFLAERFGAAPAVALFVLSERHWVAFGGAEPFGMPHFGDGILYVAGEPARFWAGLAEALAGAPADQREAVARVYGGGGDLDLRPFFDLLVVHELTHAFVGGLPYGFGRRWLEELFCNLALHTFVAAAEPAELDRLTVFPRAYLSLDDSAFQHDLRYFDEVYSGMSPENYAWYQCRLHAAAAAVHAASGAAALDGLWRMGRESDRVLAGAILDAAGPAASSVLSTWPA